MDTKSSYSQEVNYMPQGRLAITTRADANIREMTDITHPIIKKYAEKVGADFIILDDAQGLHPHYRILQLYKLFDIYDRIISFDSDIVITPDCPNLFEIVPEDKIGIIYEDVGSREKDRKMRIARANEKFGDNGWREGYINTGVAVFSKCHKELFKQRELWMELGYDDVYLGYYANKFKFPIFRLPIKFNFMMMFAEDWNGNSQRLDNYIIHYAGQGFSGHRLEDIKRDASIFYSEFPYPEMKNKQIIDLIPEGTKTIADVGCGEGILTRYLKKKYDVTPFDIEDKNRFGLTDVRIWDITEDPPEERYDVVIASEVLEHIRWWKDALKNLLKITDKKLILTVPVGNSYYDDGHVNFWDDQNIHEIGEVALPHQTIIKKGITKPEDTRLHQLAYFIEIFKH